MSAELMLHGSNLLSNWRKESKCFEITHEEEYLSPAWIDEKCSFRQIARDICENECPVRMQCLGEALQDPEAFGMRGGVFFDRGCLTRQDNNHLMKTLGIRGTLRQKTREYRDFDDSMI